MNANRERMVRMFQRISAAAHEAQMRLLKGGDLIDVPYEAFDEIEDDIRRIRRVMREDIDAGESSQP